MWHALLRTIGREELIEEPRYSDPSQFEEIAGEINGVLEAWTMQRTKHEAMRLLGEAGVPAGACFNAEDIYSDAHLREREMIVEIDHPTRGRFAMPGCPVKLSDSPVSITPAPLLGHDNSEVYAELLGYDEQKLAELKAAEVI